MSKPNRMAAVIVRKPVSTVICISDTHVGCKVGLCPRDGAAQDDGGVYMPSKFQLKLADMWDEFWGEWVPEVTHGDPYCVVHNGDALDGVHHQSTTQWSHNLNDQAKAARKLLAPVVESCEGRYYHIRGTEAHVGKSALEEERLAEMLGAIPNSEGQHARWDLWKQVGDELVHFLHHIGTTGSMAYESSAVMKELTEEFNEAGRWNRRPPSAIVRSHRHRYIKIEIPTHQECALAIVTPSWQGKTPFVWKIPGGRLAEPMFGGVMIRQGENAFYSRMRIWTLERSEAE